MSPKRENPRAVQEGWGAAPFRKNNVERVKSKK
jgi:hypothetical protein